MKSSNLIWILASNGMVGSRRSQFSSALRVSKDQVGNCQQSRRQCPFAESLKPVCSGYEAGQFKVPLSSLILCPIQKGFAFYVFFRPLPVPLNNFQGGGCKKICEAISKPDV
jgi:hypothetical protein